jgi:predicted O-linked N-acetylglucosamine transferase (SPINDLY family)
MTLPPAVLRSMLERAAAFQNQGNAQRADGLYRAVVDAASDDAVSHNLAGIALRSLGRNEEALDRYRRAIALRPHLGPAHANLGNLLRQLRHFSEAMTAYEQALALSPDDATTLNAYAFLSRQLCAWRDIERTEAGLTGLVRSGRGEVTPFSFLAATDDPALQLACARQYWANRKIATAPAGPWNRGARPKLRVAYLSADFGEHPVAHLTAQLFECHDRAKFEVFGFSYGRDDGGATRQRLARAFDKFVDVRTATSQDIARQMAAMEIDIAVDLMGHTRGNRLDILARRPAPVQVHYLGFPGTLGTDFIDYMLVDDFVAPKEAHAHFAEHLIYLPGSFFISDRSRPLGNEPANRAEAGLPDGAFVFYAMGNAYKITPRLFDVWMRLLRRVPGSVLWLLDDNETTNANLRREAQARGVDPSRLVFAPRLGFGRYMARHRLADLFVDTSGYNAGTTANDALFAGLPVVTCAGRSVAARMAASQLRAVGLGDLVTADLDDYESLAFRLATQPEALAAIRTTLARNKAAAPLFDTPHKTRAIEAAYLEMWDMHRRGEPARSFAAT